MSDRTRADLDLIRECSRSLAKIHREFDKHGNPADEYKSSLGHGGLKNAFDDFSGTWKKNRKKLMKSIKQLAEATESAADSYDDIDHELAKALRKAKEKPKEKS
ncbi:hypothetical protein NKH77_23350 [Streptomyces sp. M19]